MATVSVMVRCSGRFRLRLHNVSVLFTCGQISLQVWHIPLRARYAGAQGVAKCGPRCLSWTRERMNA